MTSETERKRAETQAARERLVGTVSELGTAVQDAKQRLRERAVAAVPYVAGGVGLITVLKVLAASGSSTGMQAEAYVALIARYETPLFSYAARMLGGLRDGERCLVPALAAGWNDLPGGAEPARAQEWLYALVREHCFDELARRAPAGPEDSLAGTGDCVADAAVAALSALRPAYRDLLLLRDVHGLDYPLLGAMTDMSEADLLHQLYRAREEFAGRVRRAAGAGALQRAPSRMRGLRRARTPAQLAAARAAPPRPAGRARSGAHGAAGGAATSGHRRQQARGCALVEHLVEVAALRRLHA